MRYKTSSNVFAKTVYQGNRMKKSDLVAYPYPLAAATTGSVSGNGNNIRMNFDSVRFWAILPPTKIPAKNIHQQMEESIPGRAINTQKNIYQSTKKSPRHMKKHLSLVSKSKVRL